MSTGQKIIFGRNSVSDNLTDLKVLYLPKFSEQNALPKTLPLEVLGFPEFLYMTHKCLVSQSNWVQMESKLVIKVFVATVAFFLTYCSRLFFSHIDQLALTFFHNPKHEGLFCMYEVKIMKSTTHSMHNSGLFRHKFVYSFIGRDILNCYINLDNSYMQLVFKFFVYVYNKEYDWQHFTYPEAHKKLTLLLCHKGMATYHKYTVIHLHCIQMYDTMYKYMHILIGHLYMTDQ